jgi:hypothetical protein
MRLPTAVLFLGGVLAIAATGDAQPPGGGQPPGGKGGKGGFGEKGRGGPSGMVGAMPLPGQILPSAVQEMLRLTEEQKRDLDAIQKDVDAKLDKLLTAEQKQQLKEMKDRGPGRGFGGPGGPGGFGGPKGGEPPAKKP